MIKHYFGWLVLLLSHHLQYLDKSCCSCYSVCFEYFRVSSDLIAPVAYSSSCLNTASSIVVCCYQLCSASSSSTGSAVVANAYNTCYSTPGSVFDPEFLDFQYFTAVKGKHSHFCCCGYHQRHLLCFEILKNFVSSVVGSIVLQTHLVCS